MNFLILIWRYTDRYPYNFTLINLFDLFPLQIDLFHFPTIFSSEIGSAYYLSQVLEECFALTIDSEVSKDRHS